MDLISFCLENREILVYFTLFLKYSTKTIWNLYKYKVLFSTGVYDTYYTSIEDYGIMSFEI